MVLLRFRNLYFVTTIEARGKSYVGEATNKRDSKTAAAVSALKGAYGIEYPAFPSTSSSSDNPPGREEVENMEATASRGGNGEQW